MDLNLVRVRSSVYGTWKWHHRPAPVGARPAGRLLGTFSRKGGRPGTSRERPDVGGSDRRGDSVPQGKLQLFPDPGIVLGLQQELECRSSLRRSHLTQRARCMSAHQGLGVRKSTDEEVHGVRIWLRLVSGPVSNRHAHIPCEPRPPRPPGPRGVRAGGPPSAALGLATVLYARYRPSTWNATTCSTPSSSVSAPKMRSPDGSMGVKPNGSSTVPA